MEKTEGGWAMAALLFGILYAFFSPLPAADTWWHLAGGRYLCADTFALVKVDPFSFGQTGVVWLNHEWLTQVLFYWCWTAGGLSCLYALCSVLVLLSFAIIPLLFARHYLWSRQAASVVCGGVFLFSQYAYFMDARGYVFTYCGVALVLWVALEYVLNPKPGRLAALVWLIIGWSNCHGGYVVGLALMFLIGTVSCTCGTSRAAGRHLLLAALAGVLGVWVVNPFHTEILVFPFSLLEDSVFRAGLNEWACPSGFQLITPVGLLLISAYFWRSLSGCGRALALTGVLASAMVWRHAPLACLMVLFAVLSTPGQFEQLRGSWFRVVCMVLAIVLGGLWLARLAAGPKVWTMETSLFCPGAVAFISANPQLGPNLVNPYEWGGYVQWHCGPRCKVFIDGRANTAYSAQRYAEAMYLQYGDSWKQLLERRGFGGYLSEYRERLEILDKYSVNIVLCTRVLGDLEFVVSRSPKWFMVYQDRNSAIYLRKTQVNCQLIKSLRYPVAF